MHSKPLHPEAGAASANAVAAKLQHLAAEFRLPLFFLLILLQALCIALFVHPRSAHYTGALAFVTDLGLGIRYAIYFVTALVLSLAARWRQIGKTLAAAEKSRDWRPLLGVQVASYALLLLAIGIAIPNDLFQIAVPVTAHEFLWSALLCVAMAGTVLSSLMLLAPAGYWVKLLNDEKLAVGLAALVTLGIYFITGIFQNTWDDFLGAPTIALSKFFLELFFDGVYANTATTELGIGNFVVLISSTCSGYEGMGMIVSFLAWYSLTFRQDLKYPNALLLYPVALLSMWIFNCIRIAALIAIGYQVSPDIALQGFHSNAGWIYFLCVSIGLILIARRMPFFSGKAGGALLQVDDANILLLPELVLLTATLLTAAVSAGFDWLYPARMILGAITLALIWKRLPFDRFPLRLLPVASGIAVFLLWIAIVPNAPDKSTQFAEHLTQASTAGMLAWLAIRIIGSVIIVPLAEELAFRGYLIDLLSPQSASKSAQRAIAWLPLVISSLCFGALHSQWIAGTLAGLVFGLVRFKQGSVWDAVVSHMVANGLLAAYVLTTQQWSYW